MPNPRAPPRQRQKIAISSRTSIVKRELAHLHATILLARAADPLGLILRPLVDKYAELPEKFLAELVKQWRLDASFNPIWRGRAAHRHVGTGCRGPFFCR